MNRDWEWDYDELVDPGLEDDPRDSFLVVVASEQQLIQRQRKRLAEMDSMIHELEAEA